MNFNPRDALPPVEQLTPPVVEIGNVYSSKGGRDTRYWLIVGLKGHYAHALGLNFEGEVVSTTSYGLHTFQSRQLLGRCEEIKTIDLNIIWSDEP